MAPTYSETFNTFVTSTIAERRNSIIDAVFKSTDLLKWVSAHRRPQHGGTKVMIPLEYGENSSVTRGVTRGSKITLVQDEIITQCWYEWHTYAGSFIRYRDDDLENIGKYRIFNMVEAGINNLTKSLRKTIEQDLFSTETTGDDKFCGLRGLVEDISASWDSTDTPGTASSATVGNLARATYPWFSNYGYNMTGKDPSQWILTYMRNAVDGVETWADGGVEAIICHRTAKNYYEDEVGETLRTTNVRLGDVGIRTVEYKGIPFITSPYATTTRIYLIGRGTMELIFEPAMWFKSTTWKEPVNQPFDYAKQIVAKGQFITKNPLGTAVIYNVNN